jgi:hypothetical protein
MIGCKRYPPRCGGLAYAALSGRRKQVILHYINNYLSTETVPS